MYPMILIRILFKKRFGVTSMGQQPKEKYN